MTEKKQGSSLVDQIVEKTIGAITDDPGFDNNVLARLRTLAAANDLGDAEKVANALRTGADQ